MELTAAALVLFTLTALYAAFTTHRRLTATQATLNALRANAYLRNTRGQVVAYAKADAETRARAEQA